MRKSSEQFAAGDDARQDPGPASADDYGCSGATPPEDNRPRIVCPTILQERTPPLRRWTAHSWIPCRVVTGFYGDGGVGKSLLAQQLQTGTALGLSWLGLPVEEIASIGVYCEDDGDELWRRQTISTPAITPITTRWARCTGCRVSANLLMTFARNGVGELTKFHRFVLEAALPSVCTSVVARCVIPCNAERPIAAGQRA